MAVRLRLKKVGRIHKPIYRIVSVDSRRPRDGSVIEEIGLYDPDNHDAAKQVVVNRERAEYWLKVGAQPSETVHSLLRKQGLISKPYNMTPKKKV